MKLSTKKRNNKWKILFYISLIINICILLVIGRFMYPLLQTPTGERPKEPVTLPIEDTALHLKTSKDELATFMNSFLQENETDFTILLEEDVTLQGDLSILNMSLALSAQFEPTVTASGNLILSLKTVTLGHVNIPHVYILQHVSNILDLPEWITIVPKEELIYVNFYELSQSETKLRLETFDLPTNDIVFAIVQEPK